MRKIDFCYFWAESSTKSLYHLSIIMHETNGDKKRLSSQHPEDLKMVVRMCENVWEQFMLRHISSIKAHWGTMGLKDSPMANNIPHLVGGASLIVEKKRLRANVESVFNHPRFAPSSIDLPIIWSQGLNSFDRSINSPHWNTHKAWKSYSASDCINFINDSPLPSSGLCMWFWDLA